MKLNLNKKCILTIKGEEKIGMSILAFSIISYLKR